MALLSPCFCCFDWKIQSCLKWPGYSVAHRTTRRLNSLPSHLFCWRSGQPDDLVDRRRARGALGNWLEGRRPNGDTSYINQNPWRETAEAQAPTSLLTKLKGWSTFYYPTQCSPEYEPKLRGISRASSVTVHHRLRFLSDNARSPSKRVSDILN